MKIDWMKNLFKNKSRIFISVLAIILLLAIYCILNYNSLIAVYNFEKDVSSTYANMELAIGGEAIGIKLLATGVLIMGIDRQDTNLQVGDIILQVNGEKIETNTELLDRAKKSEGKELSLEVNRQGEIFTTTISPITDSVSNEYKLGLWVKDSSAGVGTITFYDKISRKFAALGHGVTETKENYILPIETGGITTTNIFSIKKGVAKVPGELKGTITTSIIGEINGNTDKGIYGKILKDDIITSKNTIEVMPKSQIKEGKASIFCTLDDNTIKEYEIEIQKVLLTSIGNKNMIISITDKRLLDKTGGIVQGMSGSPIVQDGKLVGAVTHVFLNDPTRGYGVFIENMIEDMSSIE
ncbi:MAG: SpoIVB peptidase [Clostridia bacterium]|nr:SpoIVB peptidase [Clostridia bacterium]